MKPFYEVQRFFFQNKKTKEISNNNQIREGFYKIGVLKNFPKLARKYLRLSLYLNKGKCLQPKTFLKKETRAQMFSCKLFIERLRGTISVFRKVILLNINI